MSRRELSNSLLVVGIVVVLVALGADLVGLGDGPFLGCRQAAGTLAGLVAVAAGIVLRAAAQIAT